VVDEHPFRKGHWKPGDLDYRVKVIFAMCLALESLLRGLDYTIISYEDSISSKVAGDALAIETWGFLFFAASLGTVAGFLLRWGSLIIAASLLGGASYVSLAIGCWAQADVAWDYFRLPGMYLSFAFAWFTIAWATFEKLRRWAMLAEIQNEGVDGGIPSD